MSRLPGGLPYGLPAVPLALASLPLIVYLPTFYARELGIELATIGLLLTVARLWDIVTDPLIGALSDRTRSRFGRRRPWLVAGTPLAMAGLWFMFVPPPDAGPGFLLAVALLLYLGWTMITLPHQAWGAELAGDYDGRTGYAAWREGCQIAGVMLACLAPILVGSDTGGLDRRTLTFMAGIAVVALPLTILWAVAALPDPPRPQPVAREKLALRLLWDNPPFRRLILAYLLNGVANGLPASLFLLFAGERLQLPNLAPYFLALYFAAGVLATPLWTLLSRRFGKHRTWAASMLWNCIAFGAAPFLGPGDAVAFFIICLASGAALGADLALPAAIQADVVEVDRLRHGRDRAGLFFALWAMAGKLSLALAAGLAFALLDAGGFRVGTDNAPDALLLLALLYGGAPILFKLGAAALVWRFPLDRTALERLRQTL